MSVFTRFLLCTVIARREYCNCFWNRSANTKIVNMEDCDDMLCEALEEVRDAAVVAGRKCAGKSTVAFWRIGWGTTFFQPLLAFDETTAATLLQEIRVRNGYSGTRLSGRDPVLICASRVPGPSAKIKNLYHDLQNKTQQHVAFPPAAHNFNLALAFEFIKVTACCVNITATYSH